MNSLTTLSFQARLEMLVTQRCRIVALIKGYEIEGLSEKSFYDAENNLKAVENAMVQLIQEIDSQVKSEAPPVYKIVDNFDDDIPF